MRLEENRGRQREDDREAEREKERKERGRLSACEMKQPEMHRIISMTADPANEQAPQRQERDGLLLESQKWIGLREAVD